MYHEITKVIQYAREHNCSDIHLTAELKPVFRKNGSIVVSDLEYTKKQVHDMILSMLHEEHKDQISLGEDVDFCFEISKNERQRVNVYHERGNLCAAIRILNDSIPTFEDLNLPSVIESFSKYPSGLVLITGPTGSGKSTTLAAMIDYININRNCHILTMEDPIEYMHVHKNSIIHQREIGVDLASFEKGLRSALREDPDVILVGEMRDYETIAAAVTAAETGHLVLSTLHTTGAANTIDRIIDVFPASSQAQVRSQLSNVLRGVVTQQLVKKADNSGRCVALEILVGTDAVSNLIREAKAHQINSVLQTGAKDGMCTMDMDLARLVNERVITEEVAMTKAMNKKELVRFLK